MNINRDYLIINDVKKSNIKLDNGSIFFYITDKNTQNIFVNLVINVSNNDLIQKYANIENAEDYTLTMNIVKPSNTYKIVEGKLHDKEKAIFEFDLKEDCCDEVGTYKCELLTKCNINDREEITTSNKLTYKVKSSVLNDLDEITEAPEYPLVIQLFDKLSDIDQYEEDRRANELARQLAEQQRQTRFDALDADMVDKITAMDDKMVDVENRVSTKEQAVDKLIVDTKADIDGYKEAKDQEIDDYKTAKDTEINNAITNQDNKIDTAISNQNDRIALVENNDIAQNNRLDTLENRATQHESRLTGVEAKNTEQDGRLNIAENKNAQQDNRLDVVEAKNVEQDSRLDVAENRLANIGNDITNTMQPIIDEHTSRLDTIEAIDVAQNNRLNAIEVKNQQQDDRLLNIEKVNKRQDIDLKCLFTEAKNNMMDITEEGNSIYLQNSTEGHVFLDEIKGNTMVNCNKEPDKELILNGNINTSGDNTVTITEGVDGGLVDVALEGNTLVNVSKTKDSTAITKAYTVENSGNHIPLQGDVDGDCRPVITGNTLWIDNATGEVLTAFDETKNLRLQSTFEDNLVTQEMVDNGEEVVDNLGKYRVTYKVTGGKNKANDNNGYTMITWSGYHENHKVCDLDLEVGKTYTISCTANPAVTEAQGYRVNIIAIKNSTDTQIIQISNFDAVCTFTLDTEYDSYYISAYDFSDSRSVLKVQLEEGDTATSYEPYKEYTKTLYLNSPLLEGDTIEEKHDGIYHVHRYTKVVLDGVNNSEMRKERSGEFNDDNTMLKVPYFRGDIKEIAPSTKYDNSFCDKLCWKPDIPNKASDTPCYGRGNLYWRLMISIPVTTNSDEAINAYLQSNPLTFILPLKTPTYELIEQSNLVIPSYTNGHLDLASAVPVEKAEFKSFEEELTYLYPATSYTLQFVSDKAIAVDITLGGTSLLAQNIVTGLNRIAITTPETLVDNKLIISGAGAKISEVVVTDTDREFEYFEGMKSVGECEDLEVVSCNKNLFDLYNNYILSGEANIHDISINNDELTVESKYTCSVQYWFKVEKGQSYTLSFSVVGGSCDNGGICRIGGYNPNDIYNILTAPYYIREYLNIGDSKTYTFTPKDNFIVVALMPNSSATFSNIIFKGLMLTKTNSSTDYIPHQSNTQQLTHEPLRAVGNTKDRYVLIDGKWYIERNCAKGIIDGTSQGRTNPTYLRGDYFIMFTERSKHPIAIKNNNCKSNNYKTSSNWSSLYHTNEEAISCVDSALGIGIKIANSKTGITSDDENAQLTEKLLNYFQVNPVEVVYQLETPVYEPINYNPLEVYADVTHISANSVIPTNVVVKNHGYNCLLKPSTTYTISSNLGLNTVTTGADIGDSCLRFMDTDTSDVTTMKDVLVLEGDWTTKANLIPSNFSGIESCFEQEYDEEKGKYKVNVKVANEDRTKENNITFYINEPLRGVGTTKDRVYVKDDKVVVERNCGSRPYEDGDFGTYPTDKVNTVYPLAEPTYEEIEYNDTKLLIESFKNSSLSYNSNIPVTSTVHYSYSVPIVDTVAQTASISDEQDVMIIDLATQVSVLEMMTM